jgi:hypothetical protein
MLLLAGMKRHADRISVEAGNRESEMSALPTSQEAQEVNLSASRPVSHSRPEIAVLGWDVRSYRLSLRQSKT